MSLLISSVEASEGAVPAGEGVRAPGADREGLLRPAVRRSRACSRCHGNHFNT